MIVHYIQSMLLVKSLCKVDPCWWEASIGPSTNMCGQVISELISDTVDKIVIVKGTAQSVRHNWRLYGPFTSADGTAILTETFGL